MIEKTIFFTQYSLLVTTLLSAFVLIGYAVRKLFVGNSSLSYYNLFSSAIVGLFSTISAYAIFANNGKTVLSFFILIPIYFLANRKQLYLKTPHTNEAGIGSLKNKLLPIALGVLLLVVYFTLPALISEVNTLPHIDFLYYSSVARNLGNGNENYYQALNIFSSQSLGVTPYHYFELWSANFFSKITGVPIVYSLTYICFPLFSSIVFLGTVAVMNHYKLNKVYNFIIPTILLLIGPIPFAFLTKTLGKNWLGLINDTQALGMFGAKLLAIYILGLQAFLIVLKTKNYTLSVLLLSLVLSLNISLLAVPLSIIAVWVGAYVFAKFLPRQITAAQIAYIGIILIAYFLFYTLNISNKLNNINSQLLILTIHSFTDSAIIIKKAIGYGAWIFMYTSVSYIIPITFVAVFYKKIRKSPELIFLHLLVLAMLIIGFVGATNVFAIRITFIDKY